MTSEFTEGDFRKWVSFQESVGKTMDPYLLAFVFVFPHLNDHRGTNVLVGPPIRSSQGNV